MQAYQIIKHGEPLELRTVKKPIPTSHQVLAKTLTSGVCHTDVHVAFGDWGSLNLPLTPGHEGVGIVKAVGPEVTTLKVGDRVGVPWLGVSCMHCELCKAGRQNLCETQKQTGFKADGSFAEYFIVDERFAAIIPENVSDSEAAPILCAGLTSYKAISMAEAPSGARIVIVGACGGLGHLGIQYAKAMGYEVVALDIFNEQKKKMIQDLGTDFIVDLAGPNISMEERFSIVLPKRPIVASIIFAPALQAVSDAVTYLSPGATIVTVALPCGQFSIDVVPFTLKGLRLQASIVGTPADLTRAFEYVSEGKVKAHVVEQSFDTVNQVLVDLKNGKSCGKVVLRINNEERRTETS